jgi:hypothetical protein
MPRETEPVSGKPPRVHLCNSDYSAVTAQEPYS